MEIRHCVTPSQTIGPFFHGGMRWEKGGILVSGDVDGGCIVIEGRVFDGENSPVDDALIEIWQATASGHYAHPEDCRDEPPAQEFTGFGRVATDEEGYFRFETVKPGRVPGKGDSLQAPHISVSIFARGMLKRLATRLYFADEAVANAEDSILASISDEAARASLLAEPIVKEGRKIYRFDIHLQGEKETAFFDV